MKAYCKIEDKNINGIITFEQFIGYSKIKFKLSEFNISSGTIILSNALEIISKILVSHININALLPLLFLKNNSVFSSLIKI